MSQIFLSFEKLIKWRNGMESNKSNSFDQQK